MCICKPRLRILPRRRSPPTPRWSSRVQVKLIFSERVELSESYQADYTSHILKGASALQARGGTRALAARIR